MWMWLDVNVFDIAILSVSATSWLNQRARKIIRLRIFLTPSASVYNEFQNWLYGACKA